MLEEEIVHVEIFRMKRKLENRDLICMQFFLQYLYVSIHFHVPPAPIWKVISHENKKNTRSQKRKKRGNGQRKEREKAGEMGVS